VAKEGITVDPTVLPLVVRAAAGSARDGLSILDQVLASAQDNGVTREAAAGLLGVTPDTLLDDVIDAFAARDAAQVFATVDAVMEGGHDPRRFAQDVLERLRDLVVLDAVPDASSKGLLDCPADQLERMGRQALALGSAGLSRAADLFAAGLTEMRGTTAPRLLLELVCARVLLPAASSDQAAVLSRVERLERRLDIAGPPAAAPPASVEPRTSAPVSGGSAPSSGRTEADAPALARTSAPVSGGSAPSSGRSEAPTQPAAPAQSAPVVGRSEPAPPPAWPTTAPLGAAGAPPAQPEPAVEAQPSTSEAAATAGLDAAALRRGWDAVLDAVKAGKRVTHARLLDAQVLGLQGRRLQLGFSTPTLAKQFAEGVHIEVLQEALLSTVGAAVDVVCTVYGGTQLATDAAQMPGLRPAQEGFAPGDEAVEDSSEDEGAPRPAPSATHGEDAALALVTAELGGTVMGTQDQD